MRKKKSHKGDNGKVLIIGGSKQYSGAPALVGLASLKVGADLARIAAPEKVAWAICCFGPDLITEKCRGQYLTKKNEEELLKATKWADVVVLGNGMTEQSNTLLKSLLTKINKPKVVDAQAIKVCSLNVKNVVLTPHEKELEDFKQFNKIKADDHRELQKKLKEFLKHNIILVKGVPDLLITNKKITPIKGGNPGLTVGGTGDVLAGMIAGYIAQGVKTEMAATRAAKRLKIMADHLQKLEGYGFIASQLV